MERKRKADGGVAILETALVLSLLFLILFGIMEFATLFFNRGVIINASREGARFGAVFNVDPSSGYEASPKTDAEITQRVLNYSEGHLISFQSASSTPNVTITPDWTTRQANGNGGPLRVEVSYQFSFLLLPNLASGIAGGSNLSAETFVRME